MMCRGYRSAICLFLTGTCLQGFCQQKKDSVLLINLVRSAYRWHNREIVYDQGFDPVKARPADTFYSGIDRKAVDAMIGKYRKSGYFDEEFLQNYEALASRMNRELHDGSVRWREGALPPFNQDADPWCNCAEPAGGYWQKLRLSDVKINGLHADLHWTWGNNYFYHLKAVKKHGQWKISYLAGYDPSKNFGKRIP